MQEYLAVGLMGPKGARAFAETFIRASDDEWREGGCGVMAMVPRGGGDGAGNATLVSYCGLRHLPDRISTMEVVYALRQDRWGQGLATEAARAVLDWAFETPPVREIKAFTRPPHAASRRVMEKARMEFQGETDRYYGEMLAVYSVTQPV